MYIVFYRYAGKVYFFGVTLGGSMTLSSTSYNAVASALGDLQKKELESEPGLGAPGPIKHVKALVQEELVIIDAMKGLAKIVPHAEGMLSLFANVDPPAYFAAPIDDPTAISVVDGPDGALALAQIHQARKL